MIKYDESLYDIVKTTLKSIDDINNYKKIVDTMSSTSIQLKDKISALYTYLKNINVNILEINTLLVNQDIQNILNNNYQVISNIDIQQLETNIKTVISYIKQFNTFKINTDNLYQVENISDEEYNNDINSLTNLKNKPSLINILEFIFTCGFIDLYKQDLNQLDNNYQELNIITNLYNIITNDNINNYINNNNYIDIYKNLASVSNYKELCKYMENLIFDDNFSQLWNNEKSPLDNDSDIVKIFFNQKLIIKKSKDNPVPSNVETVEGFLQSFDSDENVSKIINDLNIDIFKKWNTKLGDIFNNLINMQAYISFFTQLNELNTDKELQGFCNQYYKNDNIIIPQISKEQHNIILTKLNDYVIFKKKISQLTEDIINSYNKNYMLITADQYNKYTNAIKEAIVYLVNTINNAKNENGNIVSLLQGMINLDSQGKEQISFTSLISTLTNEQNLNIFKNTKAKDLNTDNTKPSTLYDGIVSDIINISKHLNIDNICALKEDCKPDILFKSLKTLVETKFQNIKTINEFGKNTEIWSNNCTGYIALNTLYQIFNNVSSNDEYLIIVYTSLIPNGFVKIQK